MIARHVVLTPGLGGTDGIAQVSRLIVRALTRPPGDSRVDVLSLHDRPGSRRGDGFGPDVRVLGAGGRRSALLRAAARLALRRVSAASVVCLHLHLSPIARLIAARSLCFAVFLHGIEAWQPLRGRERRALRRADLLLANSEHTARRFVEANPRFRDRTIHVCALGTPDEDGPRGEAAPEATDAPGFALIVGRMAVAERYKGHDVLLEIWPRVAAAVPDARLVVAGDGDDRPRLEARARALGARVCFVGRVPAERLAALYRRCAFFAMPSRAEGFGLVFLEAMRAGKACIGGAGAAAEVIEDGVTGLVVDSADPERVLEAVVRLFREPEARERMGRAGAARVAALFTEAHFRRRFRAILDLGAP